LRKQLDALRKKIRRIKKKRVLSKRTLSLTNRSISDIKLMKSQLHSLVDKIVPKEACEFVKAQIDNAGKKPQGKRYTKEFKEMCLNLYYSGPKAYKQMRKSFNLLSVRSLQKLIKKVCFRSGVNDVVFQILKIKAELLEDCDKYCTLCIDEMSLKAYLNYDSKTDEIIGLEDLGNEKRVKPACNAIVGMLRGTKFLETASVL